MQKFDSHEWIRGRVGTGSVTLTRDPTRPDPGRDPDCPGDPG